MSVYEKFLDNSKPIKKFISESNKKVSLRKLKRVNESDWKDDLAIRKNIYKIVFPILQKELLNVKFIDKRIDNETFVEHFEEYFDIETMFNSKSYISFIGDDYIIQIIEDTFTDYLGYRYEYSEDADNTYDLNVSGLIQQTVDTIVKAIPKMEDALKAKLGEFNASSVKVKSNLLDDAGGINIEYHFKSNDTISESAKDRFLKKVFGRSKLSESRTLKRTRKVKVPMNEATVNYLLRFTADGIKAGCLIGTKKDIDSIKRIYKNKSFKEIETYRLKSSDEETMYYQMEKLANSVKGKKGVDIRKTNDGKIGAIYFTDEYKGSEYKKLLD